MKKIVPATIRLRRDNEYNYEAIKNTFIPANGEVVLVDTARDGLRAKVGNGYSTYGELTFVDADLRNAVLQGYYKDGIFYQDFTQQTPFPNMINKIYINKIDSKIYFFDGVKYIPAEPNTTTASSDTAGIMKLYNTTGQNIDGTMTQKSITNELNTRVKADINTDDELLVFKF